MIKRLPKIVTLENIRTKEFNTMQSVKRSFFALRNGVVADALRKSGSPYKIIFGLNLPQLRDIATQYAGNRELADELWNNNSTRESQLLAILLYSGISLSNPEVETLLSDAKDVEVIDCIAHNILSKDITEWIGKLQLSEDSMHRYALLRLAYRLVDSDDLRKIALRLAREEVLRNDPFTISLARRLEYDSDF